MQATWKPHTEHGDLTTRSNLPDSVYAFPKQRKEPLTDASHVRNALARFDQVEGISDADRDLAFANIKKGPSNSASTSRRRAGASSSARVFGSLRSIGGRPPPSRSGQGPDDGPLAPPRGDARIDHPSPI
jgi:hypothetical protein